MRQHANSEELASSHGSQISYLARSKAGGQLSIAQCEMHSVLDPVLFMKCHFRRIYLNRRSFTITTSKRDSPPRPPFDTASLPPPSIHHIPHWLHRPITQVKGLSQPPPSLSADRISPPHFKANVSHVPLGSVTPAIAHRAVISNDSLFRIFLHFLPKSILCGCDECRLLPRAGLFLPAAASLGRLVRLKGCGT